eukprot:CAMPEP_0178703776 /NCGR_PEP_ID=MMETSP0699-20121125/13762_1 /TAXON_ID=265572 /ORGANISM="Extubocellulus spinifer, Strain CCMP396" /LENGTH=536 /DNA_ID=CAMNT_0020350949 /DNA_START=182 /DNA_END=1792 /DNA_ORIENTATION=+
MRLSLSFRCGPAHLACILLVLPLAARVRGQGDETLNTAIEINGNETSPPPLESETEPEVTSCNCDGCPSSDRVSLGLHKDLVSPDCPEGSVATVTKLRTANTRGTSYDLVTWNPGDFSQDTSINPNYVYRQASEIDQGTTCYEADPDVLPVIGDQSAIEVKLNCEAVICDFQWDVQFGCAELGVLTSSTDGGVQVLSDVDDTITCASPTTTCDSIASCTLEGTIKWYLSGIDRRLEHKEMYPGVAELMLGLALGPGGGNDGEYSPAKAMMLSARPREAQLLLAIDQDSELNVYLENAGDRWNYTNWGANTDSSFYGTIFDGTSFKEFGQTKARHFNTLSSDRPNTQFAFLGDNGQGDVCGAQSMLESANSDQMMAVLIHVVKDPEEQQTACESPEGQDFTLDLPESEKVHYHRTHSEAAIWSLEKGLISCCSASKVHYAVNEWMDCRCEGICPEDGLNTGVSVQTTKNETLAYCEELEVDQKALLDAVDQCDPERECPLHIEVFNSANALLRGRSSYIILGATIGLLLIHLIHLSN